MRIQLCSEGHTALIIITMGKKSIKNSTLLIGYRYQFFLQLKQDMLMDRLQCTYENAVLLSAYCLQCKYITSTHHLSHQISHEKLEIVRFFKHICIDYLEIAILVLQLWNSKFSFKTFQLGDFWPLSISQRKFACLKPLPLEYRPGASLEHIYNGNNNFLHF